MYLKSSIRRLQTIWISLHRKLRILTSVESQQDLKLGLGQSRSCIIRLFITYIFDFSLVSAIASVDNDTVSAVEVKLREGLSVSAHNGLKSCVGISGPPADEKSILELLVYQEFEIEANNSSSA